MMKALTLWQPWSWAIAHMDKRIENRDWPPPPQIIGHQIAIHAGLKLDEDACDSLDEYLQVPRDSLVRGAVESVAVVDRFVRTSESLDPSQTLWWNGPIGWVLRNVVALPRPIPCRGNRKLWDLPPEVEAGVLRQLAEVGRG